MLLAAWLHQAAALDTTSVAQPGLQWVLLHLPHLATLHKRAEAALNHSLVESFVCPPIHLFAHPTTDPSMYTYVGQDCMLAKCIQMQPVACKPARLGQLHTSSVSATIQDNAGLFLNC